MLLSMKTAQVSQASQVEAKKLGLSPRQYKRFVKIRAHYDKVLGGGIWKDRKEMEDSSRYVAKMRGYDVD